MFYTDLWNQVLSIDSIHFSNKYQNDGENKDELLNVDNDVEKSDHVPKKTKNCVSCR